jgi:copper chaperone CopZ
MVSLLAALSWSASAAAQESAGRTSVFRVEGMTCALCGKAIDKALREVEGVRRVAVDVKAERVTIVADAAVPKERLEQGIESAGSYEAELVSTGDGSAPVP